MPGASSGFGMSLTSVVFGGFFFLSPLTEMTGDELVLVVEAFLAAAGGVVLFTSSGGDFVSSLGGWFLAGLEDLNGLVSPPPP